MKKGKMLLILIILIPSVTIYSIAQTDDPPACFSINLLSLNTSGARCRCQFTLIYELNLPKIGVDIEFHESTGATQYNSRTFSFPVETNDGEIPLYNEGGFDICIYDIDWDLDWNPFGWFDSPSLVPTGENICQFTNSTYDAKLTEYLDELDLSKRINLAKELQVILYENLPMITSHYYRGIYGVNTVLEGIDSTLLTVSEHNPELWRNDLTNNITYAVPWQFGNESFPSYYKPAYNYFLSPLQYQDGLWLKAVYGSLFRRSPETHLYEPCLASNYSFSLDRRSITIDLKSGANFSNGDLVTAQDVKYSYDLLRTPALELQCYCNPYEDYINSTEALDNDTVKFNFNIAVPYLLESCIDNIFKLLNFGIVEQSLIEPLIIAHGYDIFREIPFTGNITDELVTSCGPFKLLDYDYNSSIIRLIPNDYWYGEGPYLDNLVFRFVSGKDSAVAGLMNHNLDIIDKDYFAPISDFLNSPDGSIRAQFAGAYTSTEMIVNLKHPILGTGELTPFGRAEDALNIRKAISHTIPRDKIASELFDSLAYQGVTPMPTDCVGFNEELEPYEFNLTLAKEYMGKAGCILPECPEKTGDLKILCIVLISLSIVPFLRKKRNGLC